MVPAKGVYMIKDIQRMQEYYGIPIIPPSVSVDIKILSFRWVGIETEIQWLCGFRKEASFSKFFKIPFCQYYNTFDIDQEMYEYFRENLNHFWKFKG